MILFQLYISFLFFSHPAPFLLGPHYSGF